MEQAMWSAMLHAGAAAAAMLAVSLLGNPGNRWYRAGRRLFWAAVILAVSGAAGGAGLNPVNLLLTAGLGLPGYGAVMALRLL